MQCYFPGIVLLKPHTAARHPILVIAGQHFGDGAHHVAHHMPGHGSHGIPPAIIVYIHNVNNLLYFDIFFLEKYFSEFLDTTLSQARFGGYVALKGSCPAY